MGRGGCILVVRYIIFKNSIIKTALINVGYKSVAYEMLEGTVIQLFQLFKSCVYCRVSWPDVFSSHSDMLGIHML